MKKILHLLLILFLFLFCYYIYDITEKKNKSFLFIGDGLLKYNSFSKIGNTCYVDDDYRSIDLLNDLNDNVLKCGNKSLHQLLNYSDVLTISIGNNDIQYNINDDTIDFYSELNVLVNNINKILNVINHYDYDNVYFLGYYGFSNRSDYINYLNFNIRKLLDKYDYTFIELDGKIIDSMIKNKGYYMLNNRGYDVINKILVEKYKKY